MNSNAESLADEYDDVYADEQTERSRRMEEVVTVFVLFRTLATGPRYSHNLFKMSWCFKYTNTQIIFPVPSSFSAIIYYSVLCYKINRLL